MTNRTILEVVVGSTVHGTSVDDGLEDLDLMAVVIEDLPTAFGYSPKDTWVERTKPQGVRSEAGDVDRTVYGLRKFISLALKGNPSILLGFFVQHPFIKHKDIFGHTLQTLYPKIVSKLMYDPFRGYMRQQHERLLGLRGQRNVTRPELVAAHGYDTKYAGHIIRLSYQGEELLSTGKLTLPMPENFRLMVKSVRLGEWTLAEVSMLILESEQRINNAFLHSTLPDKPDYAFMENWMLRAYHFHWNDSEAKPPMAAVLIPEALR